MRSPLLLLPAFLVATALACGDSGGPNPSASSITGVAGNGQTASLGTTVASPLSFVALGSNGQPVQGVAVNWTVTPAGSATFNPQTSTTDASGSASTIVTVGSVEGDLTIRANVAGVAPVEYLVHAVDPCAVRIAYTIGTTANGLLSNSDCRFAGNYYTDFHLFTIGTQQAITATMTSVAFDTWLDVYRGTGRQLGFNDNIGGGNLNSQVELILAPGTYVLAPNSRLELQTGAYSLSSATHPVNVTGCGVYWITRNTSIADSIGPADCIDSVGTTDAFYADLTGIIAFVNDTIQLTLRSTAMDPFLQLFRAGQSGFVLVASNDDSSAATTDAFIKYKVDSTAAHVIYVGSADTASAGDGAYTLTVGGSASLGPSPLLMPSWRARGTGPFGAVAALPKRALLR